MNVFSQDIIMDPCSQDVYSDGSICSQDILMDQCWQGILMDLSSQDVEVAARLAKLKTDKLPQKIHHLVGFDWLSIWPFKKYVMILIMVVWPYLWQFFPEPLSVFSAWVEWGSQLAARQRCGWFLKIRARDEHSKIVRSFSKTTGIYYTIMGTYRKIMSLRIPR